MICDICNKNFVNLPSFIIHLNDYHKFNNEFNCTYKSCLRVFSTTPSLKKHILTCSKRDVDFENDNNFSQINSKNCVLVNSKIKTNFDTSVKNDIALSNVVKNVIIKPYTSKKVVVSLDKSQDCDVSKIEKNDISVKKVCFSTSLNKENFCIDETTTKNFSEVSIEPLIASQKNDTKNYNSIISNCNDKLETSFLTFIAKLYSYETVTKGLVQEIVTELINLIENLVDTIVQSLKITIPTEYHHVINNIKYLSFFHAFDTEYKR